MRVRFEPQSPNRKKKNYSAQKVGFRRFQKERRKVRRSALSQQFTCGVVREGLIAEHFPRISAEFRNPFLTRIFLKCPQNSAEFPQTFRQNPFANDPISELLLTSFCATSAQMHTFWRSFWNRQKPHCLRRFFFLRFSTPNMTGEGSTVQWK